MTMLRLSSAFSAVMLIRITVGSGAIAGSCPTTGMNSLMQREIQSDQASVGHDDASENITNANLEVQHDLESMVTRAVGERRGYGGQRHHLPHRQAFEGCRTWQFGGEAATHVRVENRSLLEQANSASCTAGQVVLVLDGLGDPSTSCCDLDSISCAGCALFEHRKCQMCTGGYSATGSTCTICSDTADWVNDDGDACVKAACSDTKHHGLSSNMACCRCGGGQRAATPFSYQDANLVLGETRVEMITMVRPRPLTASKFSVDSNCELAKYGLSIDDQTGELQLAKGCTAVGCGVSKLFKVTCTVTAHQTDELNATATLSLSVSSFSYGQTTLVSMPGKTTFAPVGGSPSSATLKCAPSASWLSIASDGTLTVAQGAANLETKGGLTGMEKLGVVGARCHVEATVAGNPSAVDIQVFVPQVWTSFTYGIQRLFAAVGEAAAPAKIASVQGSKLKPNRFSIFCKPNVEAEFAYDTITGVGTLDGHAVLTLDPVTGTLHLAPSRGVAKTLDDRVAPAHARKVIDLSCTVHGYYEGQGSMAPYHVKSSGLTLELRDDSCWKERNADFASETLIVESTSLANCWKMCRDSPHCTDFRHTGSETQTGSCYFMGGLCTKGSACSTRNRDVYTKIERCGERTTCILIHDFQHRWAYGAYCPVGESTHGPVYMKKGNTVPDTLYLSMYDSARDGPVANCSTGRYVLKESAPGKDFEDPESDYIELKGEVMKCIGDATADLVDLVFTQGFATLDSMLVELTAMSCGPPNTTMDNSDEEGEEEEGVPTVVLDDPSTSDWGDYWMHPCDCFPESWGAKAPVTDDSVEDVPAGSGNMFIPPPFEIVAGQFVCESQKLLGVPVILESEGSTCEVLCRESNCKYYWEGEVEDIKQCRLYSGCDTLIRESSISGSLKAMPDPDKFLCRVADPAKCWKVSGRRGYLKASPTRDRIDCEHQELLEQCDHKLLMGGWGVETCGRCTYRDPNTLDFQTKTPVPATFQHGQKVNVNCWQERFQPTKLSGGTSSGETLTCVSGKWLAKDGSPGLSNFACAACMQIASKPYRHLDARDKQELYFLNILEVQMIINTKTQRIMLNTGALDGQLDSSPGAHGKNLLECQGDCDQDADCQGFLRCFQRSGYTEIPGCEGKGMAHWDYCVVPALQTVPMSEIGPGGHFKSTLDECDGHCASDSDCTGSLRCWKSSNLVPGCRGTQSSGWDYCYDPAKYKDIESSPGGDGKGLLEECQGDCDSDSDCRGSLKCFQNDKTTAIVTNCRGNPVKNWDYCYDPSKGVRNWINRGDHYSGSSLGVCEGDCDSDSHCSGNLRCFQRDSEDDSPGCKTRPSGNSDACYDPHATNAGSFDNHPGESGKRLLYECEGDCDSDSDCEGLLVCAQRDSGAVHGCSGSPQDTWDYCVRTPTTSLRQVAKPHPKKLGECQGDCDNDDHCESGLKCFQRIGKTAVPGCEGTGVSNYHYCHDPTKALSWDDAGSKISMTGLVMRTADAVSDDRRIIMATGRSGWCLQADATAGFLGSSCSTPPIPAQLFSFNDLPTILETEFKDPGLGLVPVRVEQEASLTFTTVSLKDFILTQDCGEHAISSLGWKDDDSDNKLEIFADCTRASTIGNPSPQKTAVLGGELDLEFTTCGKKDSETGDQIKYRINEGTQFNLGTQGRNRGDRDKITITYSEPFDRLQIWGGNDGWMVCRVKLAGDDLPTASLEFNFGELPCWVKSNTCSDCDCRQATMEIKGNRMPFELAYARIECPAGQVITYLKKEAVRFLYRCSYVAGIGACTPGQTAQVDVSSGKFDALKSFKVECPPGQLLQSFKPEESSGGKWLRARYTCCASDGIPMALVPTGRLMDQELEVYEGIYCPTSRDDSGRLSFSRVHSFSQSDTMARTISYNRDAGTWCVNGKSGDICVSNEAAHPLDDGFAGEAWEALAVSDFDGEFAAKGVAKGQKKGKRKFPTLIEFGATQPEYLEECKDEVTPGSKTFDLEQMNKNGETLSEGNPCKLIAGTWKAEDATKYVRGEEVTYTKYTPQGTSYWETHGYDGTDTERGAGTTYDQIRGCGNREISRDLKAAEWEYGHDTAANVMDLLASWYTLPCALAPNGETAPMGLGFEWKSGDICEKVVDRIMQTATFINDQGLISRTMGMAEDDNADCNSLQHGLSRIFCDLHCIRDAVKAGDKAILRSLERAVGVVSENTNLLLEYYNGNLQDTVDSIADKVGLDLAQQAQEMKSHMGGMFGEMSAMVGEGRLTQHGRETVLRATESLAKRLALGFHKEGSRNGTNFMQKMAEEVERLHAVVRTSSRHRLKPAMATAQRVADSVTQMRKVLTARVHLLGLYHIRSMDTKSRQRSLTQTPGIEKMVEEFRENAARATLLKLDTTWWALRRDLDSYLEKAQEQADAYGLALDILEGYTSHCSSGFSQLQKVYNHALRAEKAAHRQLQQTWAGVITNLGLLASHVSDSRAFAQLDRLDAASISSTMLGANVSEVCAGGPRALELASNAIAKVTEDGLTEQTASQVRSVAFQSAMLRQRFLAGGMSAPDMSEVQTAWDRVHAAYKEARVSRHELAQELLQRLQHESCGASTHP